MTSHCLSVLITKRADLAGEVNALEASIAQARANLLHIDAVIRLLDPDAKPEAILPKRLTNRSDWFGVGELPRLVLDVLRTAAEPMPTREVARVVMERRGLPAGDKATFLLVEKRVDRYLRRQDGGLLERVAHGPRNVGWRDSKRPVYVPASNDKGRHRCTDV